MERSVEVHAVWKIMCKHAPSQVCSAFAHFVLQEPCKFAYFILTKSAPKTRPKSNRV